VDDLLNLNERLVEMESFTGKHNAAGLLALLIRVLRDLGVDPGTDFPDPHGLEECLVPEGQGGDQCCCFRRSCPITSIVP